MDSTILRIFLSAMTSQILNLVILISFFTISCTSNNGVLPSSSTQNDSRIKEYQINFHDGLGPYTIQYLYSNNRLSKRKGWNLNDSPDTLFWEYDYLNEELLTVKEYSSSSVNNWTMDSLSGKDVIHIEFDGFRKEYSYGYLIEKSLDGKMWRTTDTVLCQSHPLAGVLKEEIDIYTLDDNKNLKKHEKSGCISFSTDFFSIDSINNPFYPIRHSQFLPIVGPHFTYARIAPDSSFKFNLDSLDRLISLDVIENNDTSLSVVYKY